MGNASRRFLITGSTGMLGTDITEAISRRYPSLPVLATDSKTLNILDAASIEKTISEFRPTVLINAAAYTDVDRAETEREKAFALNATGPANLAAACRKHNVRLVHFSTDHVFNGETTKPWDETSATSPANYYGESKLRGDEAVLRYPKALVLRVQWLYGKRRDRFTILRDKTVFTPFSDQFGAPTWTKDIAEITLDLLDRDATGLFHYAYDNHTSWLDVFSFVKQQLRLNTQLIPKRSDEVTLPAKRPKFAVLSNRKIKQFLDRPNLGTWESSLQCFLKEQTAN